MLFCSFVIPFYSFFIWERCQAFSWYCQTSPFPCSLPDLAPISASVLLRTAGVRVLDHVKRRSHSKHNIKYNIIMKQIEEKQKMTENTHTWVQSFMNKLNLLFIAFKKKNVSGFLSFKVLICTVYDNRSWQLQPSLFGLGLCFCTPQFSRDSCETPGILQC